MKFTKVAALLVISSVMLTSCASKTVMNAGKLKVSSGDIAFLTDDYYTQTEDFETSKEYAVKNFEDALLINAVAQAKGIELSEEESKSLKQSMASLKSNYGGKNAFSKMLKEFGASEKSIEMVMKQSLYNTALSSNEEFKVADPTDDELKKFMTEKYRRAKHVLISIADDVVTGDYEKSQAEKILEQAKNGADFDKLIEEHSEDPGSKLNPDGYVFTDDQMVSEFEEGVDSIKPGEFTIVKSSYGYHVIQRLPLDSSDSKFNELFEANKDSILETYKTTKFTELLKKYAEENGLSVNIDQAAIDAIENKAEEPEATEAAE